jgi:hypothetical protein
VINKHIEVRAKDFLPRDHRVIGQEAVSEDERRPYEEARFSSSGARPVPVPRPNAGGR